jgi:uracil phosphoribosyltransferase
VPGLPVFPGGPSPTLSKLKEYGAAWIYCLDAAVTPGVEWVTDGHPDVNFYAAVDPELYENAFIVPGLGDGRRPALWDALKIPR